MQKGPFPALRESLAVARAFQWSWRLEDQQMALTAAEPMHSPDIVMLVLQHVDMKQRITCCSLVSHVWNTAAGAATDSLQFRCLPDSKLASIQGWLVRHGSHLSRFVSSGGSSSSNNLSLLCTVAPVLRHLQILKIDGEDPEQVSALHGHSAPLASLTALRTLMLWMRHIGPAGAQLLRSLSPLNRLQHLDIAGPSVAARVAVGWLPASLTRLDLMDVKGRSERSTPPSMSFLLQLTNLQHLDIIDVAWQGQTAIALGPDVLSHLVQLTRLRYYLCGNSTLSKTDVASLLSGLYHLTQLKHLVVNYALGASAPPSVAQYSVLTSSSNLTHLDLHRSGVPGDYWQYMLPLGRQFPALRTLSVGWQNVLGRKSGNGLTHIIHTCPSLHYLSVSCSVREAAQLSQLTRLAGLTSLTVFSENFNLGFTSAMRQLVDLRCLSLYPFKADDKTDNEGGDAENVSGSEGADAAGSFSVASLLELQHLTQLTNLYIEGALCRDVRLQDMSFYFKPLGPEVWQQIKTHMEDIPELAGLI